MVVEPRDSVGDSMHNIGYVLRQAILRVPLYTSAVRGYPGQVRSPFPLSLDCHAPESNQDRNHCSCLWLDTERRCTVIELPHSAFQ